jgi:hypothetical protein
MKIFLLPKFATQSPRNAFPGDAGTSRPPRLPIVDQNSNRGNACGAGASCNIDFRRHRSGMRFSLRFSNALPRFDRRAPRALTSVRQRFLKLDAVFFDVLVYSGWCASRFPSARSD